MPPPPSSSSSVTPTSVNNRFSTLAQSNISARLAEVTADVERLRVQATEIHRILSGAQDFGLGRISLSDNPSAIPSSLPSPISRTTQETRAQEYQPPVPRSNRASSTVSRIGTVSNSAMENFEYRRVYPDPPPESVYATWSEDTINNFLRLNRYDPMHEQAGGSSALNTGMTSTGSPPSDPWASTSSYRDFADLRRRHEELEAEVEQLRRATSIPLRRPARAAQQGAVPNRVTDNRSTSPILGQVRDSHRTRFPESPRRRGLVPTNLNWQRSQTPLRVQTLPPPASTASSMARVNVTPSTSDVSPTMADSTMGVVPQPTQLDLPPHMSGWNPGNEIGEEPRHEDLIASNPGDSDQIVLEAMTSSIDPLDGLDDLDEDAYGESRSAALRYEEIFFPLPQAPLPVEDHPPSVPAPLAQVSNNENRRTVVNLGINQSSHPSARSSEVTLALAQAITREGQTLRELAEAVVSNGPRSSPRSATETLSRITSTSTRPASSQTPSSAINGSPSPSARVLRSASRTTRAAAISPSSGSTSASRDLTPSVARESPHVPRLASSAVSRPELDSRLRQSRERIRELARLQSDFRTVFRGPRNGSRAPEIRGGASRGEIDLVEMINNASREATPLPAITQGGPLGTVPSSPPDILEGVVMHTPSGINQTPSALRRGARTRSASTTDAVTASTPVTSGGADPEAEKDDCESGTGGSTGGVDESNEMSAHLWPTPRTATLRSSRPYVSLSEL